MSDPAGIRFDYEYVNTPRDWSAHPAMRRIRSMMSRRLAEFEVLLTDIADAIGPGLDGIVAAGDVAGVEPFWRNGWFEGLDAISLCGILALRRPKRYIEVGSGNSTKFARWVIDRYSLPTEIVSIDPHPRADINTLCNTLIRARFEDVDPAFAKTLTAQDVLFVDNSHRSFVNSDVTVFFMEYLPILPTGMVFGLHDIFLPYDYPNEMKDRYYNEQYLLASFLYGGGDGSKIYLPVHFI